ncbi:MAG TPA: tetratricopeptide repeat protein [Pseudomonadales bacterium]|nr:tetratricopeptide repeat protein [Pseudomonadales bacterium]
MEKYVKPLVIALAITTGSVAFAAGNADLESLRDRVANGDTQAAWKQAQQMRGQWESDPEFDYLYGLLAYDQGHYNDAQFSLERVTLAEPDNVQARLALAKSYYKLGDEHSAARHFEVVKKSNPPAYVMRDVNHYMAGMGQSRIGSLTGFVEAGLGHDNNINSTTGDSSIANPTYNPLIATSDPLILLNPDARKESGNYDFLQGGLNYYRPLDADTGVEASGRIGMRNNFSTNDYDTNLYHGSVSVIQAFGKDQLRGTFTALSNRTSDSDNQNYYSLSADWTHYTFGGWSLSSALFVNEVLYPDDDLRDIYQYIGNVAAQHRYGRLSNTFGVIAGDESAQKSGGDQNARAFGGAYYDVNYDLSGGHQIYGQAFYQHAHYNGMDPFFYQTQDVWFGQYTLGWDWRFAKPLRLRTEVIYSNNDSDIDYYSYERTRVQTGIRYSF